MSPRSECVRSRCRNGARTMALAASCLALAAAAPASTADDDPKLESNLERLSYMVGYQIGQNLIAQGLETIDARAVALALDDAIRRQVPRLTNEEMAAVWSEFQAAREANQAHAATMNLESGQAFLASNAGNDGVEETPEGIQYRILRSGEGPKPGADDEVVGSLPRAPAGRNGVRQLLSSRRTRRVRGRRGDPRVAACASGDAGRVALGSMDSGRPRVRRTGRRQRDRSEPDPALRDRAHRDQAPGGSARGSGSPSFQPSGTTLPGTRGGGRASRRRSERGCPRRASFERAHPLLPPWRRHDGGALSLRPDPGGDPRPRVVRSGGGRCTATPTSTHGFGQRGPARRLSRTSGVEVPGRKHRGGSAGEVPRSPAVSTKSGPDGYGGAIPPPPPR